MAFSSGSLDTVGQGTQSFLSPAIGSGVNFLPQPSNSSSAPDWGIANPIRDFLGNSIIQSIGGGNVTGDTNPFSAANLANPSSLTNRVTAAQNSAFWSDLFLRAVVIILGFIFVAIGLSMFKVSK